MIIVVWFVRWCIQYVVLSNAVVQVKTLAPQRMLFITFTTKQNG